MRCDRRDYRKFNHIYRKFRKFYRKFSTNYRKKTKRQVMSREQTYAENMSTNGIFFDISGDKLDVFGKYLNFGGEMIMLLFVGVGHLTNAIFSKLGKMKLGNDFKHNSAIRYIYIRGFMRGFMFAGIFFLFLVLSVVAMAYFGLLVGL